MPATPSRWARRSRSPSGALSSEPSTEESGRLQLLRDLLDRLLDVGGLPGARAHELAAPEQEDDDLRLVDAVHEAGELLRLVLHLLESEGDRDRVQVDLRAQVAGRDDVLDLDHGVLLDRDPGRLDLLRDRVDRSLHVVQALRARADDLAAAEEQGRRLRLLQPVDQARELLGLVFRPAEGEGDRLEVELPAKGGRRDDVLNLYFGHPNNLLPLG